MSPNSPMQAGGNLERLEGELAATVDHSIDQASLKVLANLEGKSCFLAGFTYR